MKYIWILIAAILMIGCDVNKEADNPSKGIIVPAYFSDTQLWDKVLSTDIDTIAVMNPANGVGESAVETYEEELNKTDSLHKIIGYIYTTYAARDIEDVKAEIDKWLELYPKINGFFFDEVSAENFEYYKEIYDYVKSKGDYLVVLNPGRRVDSEYYTIADLIVTFEGDVSSVPEDACDHTHSALIVYNARAEDMVRVVRNYGCDYFYVTDSGYNDLPSYFDEEIMYLK